MLISKSMVKKVVTIDKDSSIYEAKQKMAQNGIRHLPVIDQQNKLIGIVTDRDLRGILPSFVFDNIKAEKNNEFSHLKIKDIMTINPITVSPSHTIQDALLLIQKNKVGAFPVVDDSGTLKGIISVRDLLNSFINVLGIGEPGVLLGIIVENKIGELKRIVDIITEENISCGSILVSKFDENDKRVVFPYLLTTNIISVKKKLKQIGYTLFNPIDWYLDQVPKNE